MTYTTKFGSLETYEKGSIELIDDDAKHYVFSNMFEVASDVEAVGEGRRRQEHGVRARGASGPRARAMADRRPRRVRARAWTARSSIELVEARRTRSCPPASTGSVAVDGEPAGTKMGRIVAPAAAHGAAARQRRATASRAEQPGVILLQTIQGDDTVERWAEICLS